MSKFANAILCEDVRDELGGKHSLMGVLAGDIVVPIFPATIQLAMWFQYTTDGSLPEHFSIVFRLMQDETEMAKASVDVSLPGRLGTATIVLPKGHATFEKPTAFRLLASVNGAPEEEVIRKQVMGPTASPTASALPA